MIAIISSTIFPSPATATTQYRSIIPPLDRLKQTKRTIESLQKLNFSDIYLFDNSGFYWVDGHEKELFPAKIIKINSLQYTNKGLSELIMLVQGMQVLPENTPILKISGRYELSRQLDLEKLTGFDFAGKLYDDSISTRSYYFKDKNVMEKVLMYALNNMYYYKHRVTGFRSLRKVIKNAFCFNENENYYESSISIERGMYNAIKNLALKIYLMPNINIRGVSGYLEHQGKIINE